MLRRPFSLSTVTAVCMLACVGDAAAASGGELQVCITTGGAIRASEACKTNERVFVAASQRRLNELRGDLASLQGRIAALKSRVRELKAANLVQQATLDTFTELLAGVSRPDDDTFRITGNLQVVNGTGFTDACPPDTTPTPPCAEPNGLGNLIVGYNADAAGIARTGSHNVVVGDGHTYTATSGFVSGSNSSLTGTRAFIGGGNGNTASGEFAFVAGGRGNLAGAADTFASGRSNRAAERFSFIGGGVSNTAESTATFVGGGRFNHAVGNESFVGGGTSNFATGIESFIAGGSNNTASGFRSVIAGGTEQTAPVTCAWIITTSFGC